MQFLLRQLLLVTTFYFALLPIRTSAQNVQNFAISSFDAEYYLSRDDRKVSYLRVFEKIAVEFPEYNQNHGIVRVIPNKYKGYSLHTRVLSVTDAEGKSYPYKESNQNDNRIVKIGDPNSYAYGQTTYYIVYEQKNVVGLFDDHDEFYWDINGDQWQQTFGSVSAKIFIPNDIALHLQNRQLCFAGLYSDTTQSDVV